MWKLSWKNMMLSEHLHGGTEVNDENLGPNSLSLGQAMNTTPPEYDRVPPTKLGQDNHS
jgi:hypothetical protein